MKAMTNTNMLNELDQINQHLKTVGIKVHLSVNDLKSILETESETCLRSALNDASSNEQAVRYLNDLFEHTLPSSSFVNEQNAFSSSEVQSITNITHFPSNNIEPEREYLSHHVYGVKGALCFSVDKTKQGFETLSVDAANSTAPKVYDWSNKIRLQLTQNELPIFVALIMGYIPKAEFSNHNGKGMKIVNQGKSLFFQLYGKNLGNRSIPCGAIDSFYVASLSIRQLNRSQSWLDGSDLHLLLKQVVTVMTNNNG